VTLFNFFFTRLYNLSLFTPPFLITLVSATNLHTTTTNKKQQIETDINSKKKENPASTPYPFVIFMYVRDRQLFHLFFFPTPISLLLHQHQKYHLG